MADTKTSSLTADTTPHGDDLVMIVDTHDTTMATSGTNKKATLSQLIGSPSAGQLLYATGSPVVPAGAAKLTVGSAGQLNFASQSAPASPTNGDSWHDSGQQALAYRQTGLTVFRPGLVYVQNADVTASTPSGASLVSTTGAAGDVALPAGFLNVANRTLRVRAGGYLTTGTSSGAVNFAVALGANIVAACPNVAFGTSRTNATWWLECDIAVKTLGGAGVGKLDSSGVVWAPQQVQMQPMSNGTTAGTIAPQTQVSIDTTAGYTLDFQCTSSGTGNSVTLTNLTVEVLG